MGLGGSPRPHPPLLVVNVPTIQPTSHPPAIPTKSSGGADSGRWRAERAVRGVRSLPRPVSSGELLRSGRLKSRGSQEWPRGARLSVVWGGSAPPAPPVNQQHRDPTSGAATKGTDARSSGRRSSRRRREGVAGGIDAPPTTCPPPAPIATWSTYRSPA